MTVGRDAQTCVLHHLLSTLRSSFLPLFVSPFAGSSLPRLLAPSLTPQHTRHTVVNIVIIGAGDVGFELSKLLSSERHDVVLLDTDGAALQRIRDELDVLTVEGSGTSPGALVEARARDADLLIAVTDVDEVNIIASMMGRRLGAKSVIARVRNDELSQPESPLPPSELGIDTLIHPELTAAQEVVQLLRRAAASDLVSLADGNLQVIGVRLEDASSLVNQTVEDVAEALVPTLFRVAAIGRRGSTIMPRGHTTLNARDHLFVICKSGDVETITRAAGHTGDPFKHVMVAGGTAVGELILRELSADSREWHIKLIEPDHDRAQHLSATFPDVLVLQGDPTDPDLLAVEGAHEMDAFLSVTADEESNIISAMMAKHQDVSKTVALVSKPGYIPLIHALGLDAAVNVKASASDEIHRYVRSARIITERALRGIRAEAIEIEVAPHSDVVDARVEALNLPDGCVLGGLKRLGEVEIITGDTTLRRGDHVIAFALRQTIDQVVALFE